MTNISRAIIDGVLSENECLELISVARSLGVCGYRSGVCSCVSAEVAASAPELLVPMMGARERVRDAVERALGLELGLLVEFTGLISWRPGAFLGWHHDANRDYLRQRSHSAVCYLNTSTRDFVGGDFLFRQGDPQRVTPLAGRVVACDAHEEHAVEAVQDGERFTLTLWFTQDAEFNEDTKLLARLAGTTEGAPGLPESMYQLPDGVDLRLCRLAMMGCGLRSTQLLQSPLNSGAPGSAGTALELVLHPAALAQWLDHKGDDCAHLGAGLVATSVRFKSVTHAALCIHEWARRRCGSKFSREHVCVQHQRGVSQSLPGQAGPSCSWLGFADGACADLQPPAGSWLAKVLQELVAASEQHAQQAVTRRQQYEQSRESWLRLGTVF